jgi:hypothetical protein
LAIPDGYRDVRPTLALAATRMVDQ